MLLLENLISLFAPFSCLGCGVETNRLLCQSCVDATPVVPSRCYRCRATTRDFAVCGRCSRHTPLRSVWVARHYEGLPKELLHSAKYERARSGLRDIATDMTSLFEGTDDEMLFVPVPTATSRVRQRGYDQAVVLAQEIATNSRSRTVEALVRLGQAHQVGAGRKERLEHLQGAFRVIHATEIRGKRCVLVDDVITTGATIETAARMLKKAGAKQVDAVVYCQAG